MKINWNEHSASIFRVYICGITIMLVLMCIRFVSPKTYDNLSVYTGSAGTSLVEFFRKQNSSPSPTAQGAPALVGAPVDPRYGSSEEVAQLADFGYDEVRNVVRVATIISAIGSFSIATFMCRRKKSWRFNLKAILFAVLVPVCVHVLGIQIINQGFYYHGGCGL